MKNKFKEEFNKKRNMVFLILLIIIILTSSVYFYKKSNSIKVIYITSGFSPYSEEVICTISKNTKNKIIKNKTNKIIFIKECTPESVIIKKNGEIKEVKYGEEVYISGLESDPMEIIVCGPVYYLKFEK